MPDYQKGKIYRLTNDEGMNYYGSSCQPLSVRMGSHLRDFNCWKYGKGPYVSSFKIIERGNYEIVLCENFPCNDVYELKARERWYIENNECVNKVIPNRTPKEYRQANLIQILEYHKEYQKVNSVQIKEQRKKYRQNHSIQITEKKKELITCICGSICRKNDKARHDRTIKHQQFLSLQETV